MAINGSAKKYFKFFCCVILLSLLIEVLVCNFRVWESMKWNAYDLIATNSIKLQDNQIIEDGSIIAPFREDGWCDVVTEDLFFDAKNLYLNCQYLDENGNEIENSYIPVTLKARDEGKELEYVLGTRTICNSIEKSQYNRLNLAGNAKSIKLTFEKPANQNISAIKISGFSLNEKVPFEFSVIRFLGIIFVIVIIVLFRPQSNFYKLKFSDAFKEKKAAVVMTLVFCLAISLFCVNINRQYNSVDRYYTQYHALAEAILDGHVYLNEKPAEELATMENPYDTSYRDKVLKEANESYHLDYAYYNGNYYVYFGIVPVLMTLLPFYAITGQHLPITVSVSFYGTFYIIGCFCFLWCVFKKYFKNVPLATYLLSSVMLSVTSGMFYAFRGPAFYGLPIIAAAAFSIWGLYFWVKSVQTDEVSLLYSSLGALCIALTAGCRPQFLIIGVTAFVWYGHVLFSRKHFLEKEWFKLLASLAVPVLIVAVGVMYYNYIRFGSVFDFGANYNLTSNDMTHRGWHWDRTILGLFVYLFDPTKVAVVFPFLLDSIMPISKRTIEFTNYLGVTIFEANFGGVIYNHLILGLPIFSMGLRKHCDKKVFALSTTFAFMAVLVVIVDTQMAGLVGRYVMDFGWMLCVSAVLLLASVETHSVDNTLKKLLRGILLISVFWGLIYELLLFFNKGTNTVLVDFMPRFYYEVQSMVQFWL